MSGLIIQLENQCHDVINYGAQVSEAAGWHRQKGEGSSDAEFLSGFTKDDKLMPVITKQYLSTIDKKCRFIYAY